jgi:hypothetical protein
MNWDLIQLLGDLEIFLGRKDASNYEQSLSKRCKLAWLRMMGRRDPAPAWDALVKTDPRVQRAVQAGWSPEEIAVMLAADGERLKEEYMKLHALIPVKLVFPDGTIKVWHCPHEQIPETKLQNPIKLCS